MGAVVCCGIATSLRSSQWQVGVGALRGYSGGGRFQSDKRKTLGGV